MTFDIEKANENLKLRAHNMRRLFVFTRCNLRDFISKNYLNKNFEKPYCLLTGDGFVVLEDKVFKYCGDVDSYKANKALI